MELLEFFRETGRQGGKKAAKTMSKAARVERAQKAAAARWKKAAKTKGDRAKKAAAASGKVRAKKAAKRKG
jgi:hypothetical protein